MKNLKNVAATIALAGIIMIGSSVANAGIIINNGSFSGKSTKTTQQCSEKSEKSDWGIIINNIVGIIINNFGGGIIIDNATERQDCGIIINNGIIIMD